MSSMTVSSAEFRRHMKTVIDTCEERGLSSITVIRNSKPWFVVEPCATRSQDDVDDTSLDYEFDTALKDDRRMDSDADNDRFATPQDLFAALDI